MPELVITEVMKPIDCLRQQMEQWTKMRRDRPESKGLRFVGMEDLLLQHGTVFQRAAKAPVTPQAKQCFAQAYRLATHKRSKWIYCEGQAISPRSLGLGVLHAWVTRRDNPGEAYELAWPEGDTTENTAYIGIAFDPEFVKRTHKASGGKMWSVLDTWWLDYPLVTGETRIEDVIWKGAGNER